MLHICMGIVTRLTLQSALLFSCRIRDCSVSAKPVASLTARLLEPLCNSYAFRGWHRIALHGTIVWLPRLFCGTEPC